MRAVAFSLILVLANATCGCGTIGNLKGVGENADVRLRQHDPQQEIYGGVRDDVRLVGECLHPDTLRLALSDFSAAMVAIPIGLYVGLVDLPLCVVGDTLTLPVTIPATVAKETLQHSNAPSLLTEDTTDPTRQ